MSSIVNFALNLQNNLSGPLRQAASSVRDFVSQFSQAQSTTTRGASSMSSSLQGFAQVAAGAFSIYKLVEYGKEIIGLGADMETTRIRYEVFTGSAEKASEAIALVSKIATTTPFGKSELLEYGQKLIGAGLATDEMGQKLKTLGNISSATGKNLGELTSLYIKNKNSGILQGEDLNQLSDAGISLKDFAKQLGTDVMGLKKLGSQGKLTFGDLDKYFESLGGSQGKWGQLNEKMSQTLTGQWSNLKDTLEQLMTETGEGELPIAKSVLGGLNEVLTWVQTNKAKIAQMFEPLRVTIQPILDGLKHVYTSLGLTGTISETLTAIFTRVGYALQLLQPFITMVAQVMGNLYSAMAKIITVVIDWMKKNDELKARTLLLYDIFKTVFGGIATIAGKVFGGIATAIDGILNKDFSKIGAGLKDIVSAPFLVATDPNTYKPLSDKAPSLTNYFANKAQTDAADATAGKSTAGGARSKSGAAASTKLSTKIGDVAGTKPTNIHITIQKLIGVESQHNTNMKDSVRGASESLKAELLATINDVSLLAAKN